MPHAKKTIGILAFGSLITDAGTELEPKITMRLKTPTLFGVEYGRYSKITRGGAPTLVPHETGATVNGVILVLDDAVTVEEARDMLWRRETGKVETKEKYPNKQLKIKETYHRCVSLVLYVDFADKYKIDCPDPVALAEAAIKSVGKTKPDNDGISYLKNNLELGIETPLTQDYKAEILRQTKTKSLDEALKTLLDHGAP